MQDTFAYQFISDDIVLYVGAGSGVGKCNIMGYWQTGNTDLTYPPPPRAVLEQDSTKCTAAVRSDNYTRQPLVDFAGSDSLLSAADYKNFPDLQMFPAVSTTINLAPKFYVTQDIFLLTSRLQELLFQSIIFPS